jgi:WD40 repeat protein
MFITKQKVTKRKITIAALLVTGIVLAVGLLAYLTGDTAATATVLKLDGNGRRVAWSPDGKTLVAVTINEPLIYGKRGSAVKVWDIEQGKMRALLAEATGKGLAFGQVVFSPDGKTIALVEQNTLGLWDANTLDVRQTLAGGRQLACVAFSPDGKLVAAGDPSNRIVHLWNAETGSLERTLDTGKAQPWSLAFSPDGKILVIGGQTGSLPQTVAISGQVQLWDAQTWMLTQVLKQENYVNTVAFSANGKLLASGGGGDLVLLWNAQTGELLRSLRGLRSGTRGVTFSPDSQLIAAGGRDGTVHVWDVETGKPKVSLSVGRWGFPGASEIYALAFSPDGKTLATASQDQAVRLWKVSRGAEAVEK